MPRRLFLPLILVMVSFAAAAVPVRINSGDPAFPFPQFLSYAHPNGDTLHNLGSRNPAGVTHAEMERAIRDAYQIMMNRADYYQNIALGGTRYIKFNSTPDCSEGTGYAMLAAAMMADKTTFDGLWLFTHDFAMNNVTRYRDGSSSPPYAFSTLPGWTNAAGANSAADGDFDIALALLIAHMQWGEFMGINDSRGNRISYKDDVIKVLRGLTDTLIYTATLPSRTLLSGTIGFDGYFKGGDSWGELTRWAASVQNLVSIGVITPAVYQPNGDKQHIDYTAPAYFRQFADFLRKEDERRYGWNIFQFERAEASSDWLMGAHHRQAERNIPFAGWVEITGDTTVRFTSFNEGEDFRAPWRTILSYMWHGNPDFSWNPVTHTVVRNRPNTFLKDAGDRFARFLWDRRQAPWSGICEKIIGEGEWWGPSMLKQYYTPAGAVEGTWALNWVHGTGSPSAVAAQDFNLMAEMYRQAELEWDAAETGDGYITSVPQYFHGFFRLLGMMILTGNHHAPLNMKRAANMKVYMDVDKTYAFENDTITYTIDYRNYGAEDGQGVVIMNRLHSDMVFISATGGGTHIQGNNSVRWDIGTVPGFKTAAGVAPTRGSVSFKVIIPRANLKRYENRAQIAASNGTGWVSNEYPNKVSSVMKRNGVDIARRALRVDKSVFRETVNPGMNATYTINFENSAEAGWMNGGRPGVNFSYAHSGTSATAGSHTFLIRGFHDAHEAYIDYGNYRISYFLFDNNYTGLGPNGWNAPADIVAPTSLQAGVRDGLRHEMITPGEDAKGRWNQRVILQLSDVDNANSTRSDTNWATMAAPTPFVINYYGMGSADGRGGMRIHRGVDSPLRITWRMFAGNYASRSWGGDWSFNSRASGVVSDDLLANWGYPISPDFTDDPDPDYEGVPVHRLHRKLCALPASVTVDNILIEEWDGYTWRRVFGNGPLPGREVNNVKIIDTIPEGVTYQRFLEPLPFGITPTINGRIITWNIPKLLVGEKGSIKYTVTADPLPAGVTTKTIISRAWASADRESPMSSLCTLVVTTDSIPPPPPEPTTMWKTANKDTFKKGDTVTYTIAYKQTHGFPVASTSNSQWTGTGTSRVNSAGNNITLNGPTDMYHNLTYGTNGVLTGSARPQRYQASVYVFGRSDPANSSRRVELEFDVQWDGLYIVITSNNQAPFRIDSPFRIEDDDSFDYKLQFKNDSLLIWIGDTSASIPSYTHTGIPVQAGYAGVKFTASEGQANGWLRNWASHFDVAYNITIRDTIPWGVSYVQGSAAGRFNTGSRAPQPVAGTVSGNVITWPVVSGMGAADALGANDSLTLTWRGVVDTAKGRTIINTAYADLAGYPKDSLGAFANSRFALEGDPDPPDTSGDGGGDPNLQTGLTVRADPAGGMFSASLSITLSSLPGASIWYTFNGMQPDTTEIWTFRYRGQPLEISTLTTLCAAAYAPGFEPSDTIRHVYEPIRTVPAVSAIFFDDVGDGLAHGVKLVLSGSRVQEPYEEIIKRHLDLISLPGLPVIDSLQFRGDTIVIRFRGAGIEPALDAKVIIREPTLPSAQYTSAHGYLAARELTIMDGVAPVIVEAVYYPSLIDSASGVYGDTLAVTFNKYAALAQAAGSATPFVFIYGNGTYELELGYIRHDGQTIYFMVSGISGRVPAVPTDGDSVRIKAGGYVTNLFGYAQENANNTAVPLKLRYPGLNYVVKAGPSPSQDVVRIMITVEPFLPSAFAALDPKVRIFDRMGKTVALSGKNLTAEIVNGQYIIVWDGSNINGRLVGTGTYLIHIVLVDQDGDKRTTRQRVYILRD